MVSAHDDRRPRQRRRAIDWARGLAVLVMIEAHALDAWTRVADRSSLAYQRLSILGGFAAPLFLWLAGLALVLSAESVLRRTGSRAAAAEAVVRRGAEIFILAFLFRLQAFIVSPGSWPVTIFRVDILNVMGPSMAVAGVVWGLSRGTRQAAIATGIAATAVAMVTPIVRTAAWVDVLPLWLQWYVRPFGEHTTFTLFPWAGFLLAGAAVAWLFSAGAGTAERRLMPALLAVGVLLVGLGAYTSTLPPIYHASSFWTSSPTFFAIRLGVLCGLLGLLVWAEQHGAERVPGASALELFGRNSLFIYWIHVELVYGYATWPLHRRLPLWALPAALVVFVIAMFGAIALRDRVVAAWRHRTARKPDPRTVPA